MGKDWGSAGHSGKGERRDGEHDEGEDLPRVVAATASATPLCASADHIELGNCSGRLEVWLWPDEEREGGLHGGDAGASCTISMHTYRSASWSAASVRADDSARSRSVVVDVAETVRRMLIISAVALTLVLSLAEEGQWVLSCTRAASGSSSGGAR